MTRLAIALVVSMLVALNGCTDSGSPDRSGSGGTGGLAEAGSGGNPGDGGTGGLAEGGSGGSGGDGGSEIPSSIDVQGTVVDEKSQPLAGIIVVLNRDFATPVITGPTGQFEFPDVEPPYELTLASNDLLILLQELTSTTPLVAFNPEFARVNSATLQGAVTGDGFPLSRNEAVLLGLCDTLSTTPAFEDGSFEIQALWSGGRSRSCDLVAASLSISDEGRLDFLRAGKKSGLALESGRNQAGLTLELNQDIETATTTVEIDPGHHYSDSNAALLSFRLMGARFSLLGISIPVRGGDVMELPVEGGSIVAQGEDDEGNEVMIVRTANLGGVTSISLPDTLALKAALPPVDGVGVSIHPRLGWSPVANATNYLVILDGAGREYIFVVSGSSNVFDVPDFGAIGAALSPDSDYRWSVHAVLGKGLDSESLTRPDGRGLWELYLGDELSLYSASSRFRTAP